MELNQLVDTIFSKQPQHQKSIQLEFLNDLDNKDLFEFLISIFTEGSKIKYGTNINDKIIVNLNNWSNKELDTMKDYFKSISFILDVKIYHINDSLRLNFDNMNYKK